MINNLPFRNHSAEADLRYVAHLCRRAKVALRLVFLRRYLLFCSLTQLFDVLLDPPVMLYSFSRVYNLAEELKGRTTLK